LNEGATWWWDIRSALFTHMGHARNKPKRLAEKLLQIREALGLSQREMAERLGNYRSHHHISKYERGRAIPFIEVLLAYSRLANVLIEQIVDDDVDLPL
jgi:transcriptional regulator with XRE-family HTH domain